MYDHLNSGILKGGRVGPEENIWREWDCEEPIEELRETDADLRSDSPVDKVFFMFQYSKHK